MKKLLVAGIAAAVLYSAPTLAADAPMKYAPVPATNWSGLYLGVNAGYSWVDPTWTCAATNFFCFAGSSYSTKYNGAMYGGQVGYNVQAGPWVYGIETSFDWADLSQDRVGVFVPFPVDQHHTRISNLGTVTGRFGYGANDYLLYVKGGYAYSQLNYGALFAPGANAFNVSKWTDGWTVGGGIEWMLRNNIVLGLEYDYTVLSGTTLSGPVTGGGALPGSFSVSDIKISTVLARASYKFGTH